MAPGAAFCAACGAPSTVPPPAATPSFAGYPAAPYPPTYGTGLPVPPPDRAAERFALTNVQYAAVLTLAGVAVGVVSDTVLFASGAASSTAGLLGNSSYYALTAFAAIFGIIEALLYYRAFARLADRDLRFRTPATLTLVLAITTGLVSLILFVTLEQLLAAQTCLNNSTSTNATGCISRDRVGGLVLAVLIGIVAFVGFIGLLIGIWRLGGKYEDSKFKVGAVLLLFPFLDLVGAILILLAAREAIHRLGRYAASFTGAPP
jgi:hypothetical protein